MFWDVDRIDVSDSLLKKVGLLCLNSKCEHNLCCSEELSLSKNDIKAIRSVEDQLLSEISSEKAEIIDKSDFYCSFRKLRMVSNLTDKLERCIFLENGACILEKFNVMPLLCKVYPISLNNNRLSFNKGFDERCTASSEVPAYKLFKDGIILLTSKEFYNKMSNLLERYENWINAPMTEQKKRIIRRAKRFRLHNAEEMAELIKDLLSLRHEQIVDIYHDFMSGKNTEVDEGLVFIFHREAIDPLIYPLILNILKQKYGIIDKQIEVHRTETYHERVGN